MPRMTMGSFSVDIEQTCRGEMVVRIGDCKIAVWAFGSSISTRFSRTRFQSPQYIKLFTKYLRYQHEPIPEFFSGHLRLISVGKTCLPTATRALNTLGRGYPISPRSNGHANTSKPSQTPSIDQKKEGWNCFPRKARTCMYSVEK